MARIQAVYSMCIDLSPLLLLRDRPALLDWGRWGSYLGKRKAAHLAAVDPVFVGLCGLLLVFDTIHPFFDDVSYSI